MSGSLTVQSTAAAFSLASVQVIGENGKGAGGETKVLGSTPKGVLIWDPTPPAPWQVKATLLAGLNPVTLDGVNPGDTVCVSTDSKGDLLVNLGACPPGSGPR